MDLQGLHSWLDTMTSTVDKASMWAKSFNPADLHASFIQAQRACFHPKHDNLSTKLHVIAN